MTRLILALLAIGGLAFVLPAQAAIVLPDTSFTHADHAPLAVDVRWHHHRRHHHHPRIGA